jgi:hypothetical protein
MKARLAALVACVYLIGFALQGAWAQGVYKWQDENGVVHYTSKAGKAGAKAADLPPITRGEMKLGVDCAAGADVDGSVICGDGFKDATARYRFHCNSPKLLVADVSNRTAEGDFKVVLRNAKAVAAVKVALFFERPDKREVPLDGPGEVKPFGAAEFTLAKADTEGLANKPLPTQFRIVCSNCP